MKIVKFNSEHRKKHFDFFNQMNHPHFNITANVDVTKFYTFLKSHQLSFTPALVYLLCRTANDIKEFRWRIRGDTVVEHDLVHPSFTVENEESDVFGFCYVDFDKPARDFMQRTLDQMDLMRKNPVFEDDVDRDDYLFMSANPWLHFTSMQHAMHYHPSDSVPRIVWGKYQKNGSRMDLPLCVQVHHAVVDGRHLGMFYGLFQEYLNSSSWLD